MFCLDFFYYTYVTDGEIEEKRITLVDSFLLNSLSLHLHMNMIKMKSRIARTIVAVLNTIYIGLFLTVLLSCSDNSKLRCLTSDNSFTACVFWAVSLPNDDCRLWFVSCIFSRLLLNSVCCTFCWFCISSRVLPCCSSCFWRSALTFEAASICSLACLWVCSFAFLRASVCNLSCSWLPQFGIRNSA